VGIALTEAMGCFQCNQLFMVVDSGHAIVRPDGHPWTGQRWRWTERGWYRSSGDWLLSPVGLAIVLVCTILGAAACCAGLPAPSARLFLGLVGVASSALLLLVLVALFSFRVGRE